MSEAGWGTDKPKVAGWYWWRRSQSHSVQIVRVNERLEAAALSDRFDISGADHVDETEGEYCGPITPDAYAAGRVAGVQEAVPLLRSVREWLKQLNDRFEAEWPNTARHTGLHIRQIDAWFHERQIEAQAQGGSVRCQRCGGSGYTQSDDPARPLSRCGTCQGDGRYQPSRAQGGES